MVTDNLFWVKNDKESSKKTLPLNQNQLHNIDDHMISSLKTIIKGRKNNLVPIIFFGLFFVERMT